MSDRFLQADPSQAGMRLATFDGKVQDKMAGKEKVHTGKLELKVISSKETQQAVDHLLSELSRDSIRTTKVVPGVNNSVDRRTFGIQSVVPADFTPRTSEQFVRKLTVPEDNQKSRGKGGRGQTGKSRPGFGFQGMGEQ